MFLEKEKQIINAIKINGGAPLFDSADEGYDFLNEYLEKFVEYVDIVAEYARVMPVIMARYAGQELKDHISDIDSRRRAAHDAAISAVNIINRACGSLGLEPFAGIDTSNRGAVAKFCGQYVREIFDAGIDAGH